ncbi:carbohydrate porin [Acidocella sp.]|uniref:carbohydrate porin n=1 Tax=Acidocella sp. TaxID=50710 RepID=UPI003D06A8B4
MSVSKNISTRRRRWGNRGACALALASLLPGAALAQGAPAEPSSPSITHVIPDVTKAFADNGINWRAIVLYNFVDNVSGGINTGSRMTNGIFDLGADADLNKLVGWQGATVHFDQDLFFLRSNESWSADMGDATVGYQPPHLFRGNYLSRFTIEQSLLNDRLDVEVGRTNLSRYFLTSNNTGDCNQLLTCFKNIWAFDAGISTPVYGTWSGRVKYDITPDLYLQAAATEDNKLDLYTGGWTWNTNTATGTTVVGEIGYDRGFDETAYPTRIELLGFHNTSPVTDELSGYKHNGSSGMFATFDQYVWRKDGGATHNPHGTALAVFAGGGEGFNAYDPIGAEAYVGTTLQAPFADRPFDSYTFQMHWSDLGSTEAAYLAKENAANGGSGKPFNGTYVLDWHAQIGVVKGVFVQPSLEYVINPNNYYNPTAKRARNAVVVGATLIMNLGAIMGFAH